MKILSLLAAATVAASLAVSATSASAVTFKPNTGPITGNSGQPAAMKYLNCRVKPVASGAKLDIAPITITNTSGVTLNPGKVITVHYTSKNGVVHKKSFVLNAKLVPGGTTGIYGGGVSCTAQVNLLG
jgi:hypothetical protein